MTPTTERVLRTQLVSAMRQLEAQRFNIGASGNLSVRCEEKIWITPSGVTPQRLRPEAIVPLDMQGRPRLRNSRASRAPRPSSEWRLHCDLYAARPDLQAIVHTHSLHATALACARKEIPAFHYMVAVAGGSSIRCAKYATFGTQALSDAVREAMVDRTACLLANHGMLAAGASLEAALALVAEVEQLAAQYLFSGLAGGAVLLSKAQMADALHQFANYRQRLSGELPIDTEDRKPLGRRGRKARKSEVDVNARRA